MASPLRPQPPAWVEDVIGNEVGHGTAAIGSDGRIAWRRGEHFTLLGGVVEEAAGLSGPALAGAVAELYRSLGREVQRQQRHSVRIWNFVPDIHGGLSDGNRYMAFNAGRFAAYCDWFGGEGRFATTLPTASAIGVSDAALSVFVLAADAPGRPVENPRQISSYHYSPRYGARPPCFARATRLGSTLLIGGTASILGEDTRHEGDVHQQVRETCANIAALIAAATAAACPAPLEALQSVRVHVRDANDAPEVQVVIDRIAPNLPVVELVQAPLCRPELLVEIEGVAVCAD